MDYGELKEEPLSLEDKIRQGFEKRDRKIELLERRISGIETALLGAGVLKEKGLELHQSFQIKNYEEDKN
jgi:hypothetical protein